MTLPSLQIPAGDVAAMLERAAFSLLAEAQAIRIEMEERQTPAPIIEVP